MISHIFIKFGPLFGPESTGIYYLVVMERSPDEYGEVPDAKVVTRAERGALFHYIAETAYEEYIVALKELFMSSLPSKLTALTM